MKDTILIVSSFAYAGFTSGKEGIWSSNEPSDPPTSDYVSLSSRLEIPLSRFIRPYQAGGDRVEIVSAEHGGSGVIKDNELKKVDGLVTAEKGLVLSIIAADCVPVCLSDEKNGVIGLLHCGWRSAAGNIIHNALLRMYELGAAMSEMRAVIGPHICAECYEVGEEVYNVYTGSFPENELSSIFAHRDKSLYLDLSQAIKLKLAAEGIPYPNLSDVNECTCHDHAYFSYRRGDRHLQNLAYFVMN